MVKIVDLTPEHLRCTLGACPAVHELEDVTPEHLRCELSVSCPAVYDVIPAELKCDVTASCPSVHTLGGQFVIIGKKPSAEILAQIGHRVAEDEHVIVIGKEYFADALPGEGGGG